MVEWSKNGEIIDFMWDRHRTGGRSLKIKDVTEDDTGIFTCKGINGFGSVDVRIELIIVGEYLSSMRKSSDNNNKMYSTIIAMSYI